MRLTQGISLTLSLFSVAMICQVPTQSDPDPLHQQYEYLRRSATLEWLFADPFYLEINFQLYDLSGKPSEQGTVEETWSREGKVIRIESPSLHVTDGTAINTNTHTRENFLVHQALGAITRPFADIDRKKLVLAEDIAQDSAVGEHCLTVGYPEEPTTQRPGYCVNQTNQLVEMNGQYFRMERSDIRKYHNHELPMDLKLIYEGKTALTMHILEVDALHDHNIGKESKSASTHIPGNLIVGLGLNKPQPKFPKEARKKHLGGTVILIAIIDKQGKITSLDTLASPDSLLTKSATDAVSQWTYMPYLLNGEPVEIDTTIMVNYNLNL